MKMIKKESCVKGLSLKPLALSIALLSASAATPAMAADTLTEAITGGKAFLNVRLRYESADLAAVPGESADALTLDTSFGYKSGEYNGFSFLVEAEDVREVLGVRDFSVPPAGVRSAADFDIIADPETTELDQAFIQYKSGGFTGKFGRQVITYDGHRFIGHVGWRQDRQTFDGVTLNYKTDAISLSAAYVTQRNRIFAEVQDVEVDDIFLNASFKLGTGKLVAYSYLLDQDGGAEIDTYGLSYSGGFKTGETKVNYTAEYATQDNGSIDTDYFNIGAGATFGAIKLSAGYEILGSDDGLGGFATPLATLHKFNGWADVFLGTPIIGLEDLSLTLDAKIGGGKFKLAYHDFSGDESSVGGLLAVGDDLGDEVDVQYTYNFSKNVYSGIKYASYSQGDSLLSPGDADRFWAWVGFKFK